MRARVAADPELSAPIAPTLNRFAGRRIITVTAHRRESLGEGMLGIAAGLKAIAARSDVGIVYPLHPNPQVASVMRQTRSEEHTSELKSLMRISYADFCIKKKKQTRESI